MLSKLIENVSPEAIVQLDPLPESEPFTRLHQKQFQVCQEIGEVPLAEKIDKFLSGGGKCLDSVRTEGLKYLQKTFHLSKYEIPNLLCQGTEIVCLLITRKQMILCY